nr:MAG TPA: hypothetical protein [Caudoviricetes sp.]
MYPEISASLSVSLPESDARHKTTKNVSKTFFLLFSF